MSRAARIARSAVTHGGEITYEWTWDQRDRDGETAGPGAYRVIGVLEARIVGTR